MASQSWNARFQNTLNLFGNETLLVCCAKRFLPVSMWLLSRFFQPQTKDTQYFDILRAVNSRRYECGGLFVWWVLASDLGFQHPSAETVTEIGWIRLQCWLVLQRHQCQVLSLLQDLSAHCNKPNTPLTWQRSWLLLLCIVFSLKREKRPSLEATVV